VVVVGDDEEDDGVNWSELENDDDEDGDYNGKRSAKDDEVDGDVVGKALRRCSRISFDLKRELYGSSTKNCESYAETDASTCRIVTQVHLSVLMRFTGLENQVFFFLMKCDMETGRCGCCLH
jgi:SWI/SNF-related matrix-associated actin-dependent regulator 1 of chromatin subfamily A